MPTKKLTDASVDELLSELARRRRDAPLRTMTEMEDQAEADAQVLGEAVVDELLRSRTEAEDTKPKRCPRCGVSCRVRRIACERGGVKLCVSEVHPV